MLNAACLAKRSRVTFFSLLFLFSFLLGQLLAVFFLRRLGASLVMGTSGLGSKFAVREA